MQPCWHPTPHLVVWNDLAATPATPHQPAHPGGKLTVQWCPDCGAIKRSFPEPGLKTDWERPTNSADVTDPRTSG